MEEQKLKNIFLNTERLKRHFQACQQIPDEVSLVDLAHSLRVWTDMRNDVQLFLDEYAPGTKFNGHDFTGGLKKLLWQKEYVIAPIPLGLTLNSLGVKINMVPKIPKVGLGASSGFRFMAIEGSNDITLKHIWYIHSRIDNSDKITIIDGFLLKRLNFTDWMNSESVKFAKKNTENVMERTSLTREILIKRVANVLGGSHPEGLQPSSNPNDLAVKYLLEYEIMDRSLPYFILIKIASDILDVFIPLTQH